MKQSLTKWLLLTALGTACPLPPASAQEPVPRAQVMIVGVAHLVAQADLHNATWKESALSPDMQAQIKIVIDKLAAFRPTKVMIEGDVTNDAYAEHYKQYLAGSYTLGANENYQFGFRLAAAAHDTTIYPIDTHGPFPFQYDSLKASAALHGQAGILDSAEAHSSASIARQNTLEARGALLDLLRYVNTSEALNANAAWYAYADRIGDARGDYAGANLVSFWYARNLHMFANIMHSIVPGDRVVVFVGAGHAARLRPLVELSPDLQSVDPEKYLR